MRFGETIGRVSIVIVLGVLGLVETLLNPRLALMVRLERAAIFVVTLVALGAFLVWLIRKQ